jgi:phosphate:Na+ symporter
MNTTLLIAGGVALILFATRFLREGLDRLVGSKLGPFLQRAARTPVRAFFAGIGVSVLAPSSTTMSALAVQAVQSRMVSSEQMLFIMAGADIGITLMVWLSALNLQKYAPVVILIGVIGHLYGRSRKQRGLGQVILAMGLLFEGIQIIQTGSGQLMLSSDVQKLIAIAADNPFALFLAVVALAVFLQSSTATILLVMGLGASLGDSSTTSPITLALTAVLAANVGVSITTLLLGWNNPESRRLAVANLTAKIFVAMAILALVNPLHIALGLNRIPGGFAKRVADSHTLFNVVKALFVFVAVVPINRIAAWLVPIPEGKATQIFGPRYINTGTFDGVSLAMGQSAREIMRAAEIIRGMLDDLWRAIKNNDESLVRAISERDNQIDLLDAEIRKFLSKLSAQPMDADDQQEQMRQIRYLTELEAIGDIIDKNLCKLAIKKIRLQLDFPSEAWTELDDFDRKVVQNMLIADTAFQTRDKDLAQKLLRHKDFLDLTIRELRDRHFARFAAATETDYKASAIQLDLLTNLKRINSHVSHVAYAVLYAQNYTLSNGNVQEAQAG